MTLKLLFQVVVLPLTLLSLVQTTSDVKNFNSGGVSFDYPNGWVLHDDSNSDAQQLTLARANNDVQIRVFVHKGRITPEKLPEAKKVAVVLSGGNLEPSLRERLEAEMAVGQTV